MAEKSATPDQLAARIAAQQHGVASIVQLREAGLSDDAVLGRVRAGRLHRVHQGVYAVGHPALTQEGRWLGAVLACGEGAVLSHRSAAELWQLLDCKGGLIQVSVPTTAGRRRRAGLRLHRRRSLDAHSTMHHRGIPVTTPARTIADLDGAVPPTQLRRAIRRAEVRGLRTGVEAGEPTRSELEHLFLRLCERHRIPAPEVNVRVGDHEVDFLWRPQRLIAETDGYRYHRGSAAFEDDHARDLDLRGNGFALHRFTYRQVTMEPNRVAASITRALTSTPK
jgi:very-short-patch-repair endonuclease